MSKSTSDYIFKKLISFECFKKKKNDSDTNLHIKEADDSKSQLSYNGLGKINEQQKTICFYELLSAMIIMSYAEEHNKIRMLFVLYDFDNYQYLDRDQFLLLVIVTLEAWGRFTQTQFPSRQDLERVGNIIFSSRDGRISIVEVAEWLDLNKPFNNLMKSLNPTVQVLEKTSTYLPLLKSKDQFFTLCEVYLNKKMTHSISNYKTLPSIKSQREIALKKDFDFKNQALQIADNNYLFEKLKIPSRKTSTMNKTGSLPLLNIPKIQQAQQQNKIKLDPLRKSILSPIKAKHNFYEEFHDDDQLFKLTNLKQQQHPITHRDKISSNNILNLNQSSFLKENSKHIKNKSSFSTILNSQVDSSFKSNFQRKKLTVYPAFKNILTIKGKTYSKQDILTFRKYFEKVNVSQTGYFSQEEYQHSIQDSELMKRLSISLYSFLDKDGDNKVSFEQLLQRTIPGMTPLHYQIFQKWIDEENLKEQKSMVNYKDQNASRKVQSHAKELNFNQFKDFLYIFTQLDKDSDGLLSLDEVKQAFANAYSPQQIEKYFEMYDSNNSRLLNIEEFLSMMTPKDHIITKNVLENQVAEYVKKRTLGKVNVMQSIIQKQLKNREL
eukprot:403369049